MNVSVGDKFKDKQTGRVGTITGFVESSCQGCEVHLRLLSGQEIKVNSIWFGLPGGWEPTIITRIKSPLKCLAIKLKYTWRNLWMAK